MTTDDVAKKVLEAAWQEMEALRAAQAAQPEPVDPGYKVEIGETTDEDMRNRKMPPIRITITDPLLIKSIRRTEREWAEQDAAEAEQEKETRDNG